MKRHRGSNVDIWGIALILFALIMGGLVSFLLYQWEARSRAASAQTGVTAPAMASPPAQTPEAKTPTPSAKPEAQVPVSGATPAPPVAAASISFQRDVLPIFRRGCTMCHGQLGGLNLADYSSLMTTGDHKPQVVPGKPEESLLVKRLVDKPFMPPTGPLQTAEIDKIKQWIQEGAGNN